MSDEEKKDISPEIQAILANIHKAFMQPKKGDGQSLRKQYWLEVWTEIKQLSPREMEELLTAIDTIRQTLKKLRGKVEELRTKKLKARAERHSLDDTNEYAEDEFLDSSATLPVFNVKEKSKGKRWVTIKPIEKPRTVSEICQAVWTVITNRAIYIVDKGAQDAEPSAARDLLIERHRLSVLPGFLDDKIVTDQLTGKPIMNLYMVNNEVKETLLWLLAERAKTEKMFRKLFIKFLKKEIIKKAPLAEWAKKFAPQASRILEEIYFL